MYILLNVWQFNLCSCFLQFGNLEELEGRIREVMISIPQEFLAKSVDAIPGRLEKLVANKGAHIEF